ncbi:MAG: small, acid-soluble spore protein, alpha/beta type [Peptostreptococcaceae bacterium]
MANKFTNPNAKTALNQMKLEIANELGMQINNVDGANLTAQQNGAIGGRVGGQMSKKLVQMGEEALLRKYNGQNK